jgi:indolepyruvate ferredoxin oxidoreductase beta subunit
MCKTKSLYLCGLGGQGVLTLANIVGNAAAESNYQVHVFNAKGMAQRGGRVSSEIRITSDPAFTYGSRIAEGGSDILICLEIGEALNTLPYMREGGTAVLLDYAFFSAPTILKNEPYPTLSQVERAFAGRTGNVRTVRHPHSPYNIYTLGFFGSVLDEQPDLLPGIDSTCLKAALERTLERNLEQNLYVFQKGMESGKIHAAARG